MNDKSYRKINTFNAKVLLRNLMLIAVSAVFFVLSSSVSAANVSLDVHGLSKHIGTNIKYNEINFGLGLSVISGYFGAGFGRYHNSRGRMSNYMTITAQTAKLPALYGARLAVDLGAVSGYKSSILPVVVPYIKMHIYRRVGLSLRYLPPLPGMMPAVVSLSAHIKLN